MNGGVLLSVDRQSLAEILLYPGFDVCRDRFVGNVLHLQHYGQILQEVPGAYRLLQGEAVVLLHVGRSAGTPEPPEVRYLFYESQAWPQAISTLATAIVAQIKIAV